MNPPRTPITRIPAPIREQVVELLREEILTGRFAPGQRLVERELCEELSVSRNTLREAYRQLESEGWIKVTANKGPSVTTISDSEARELYQVREALECLAVRLFVEQADDPQLARLKKAAAKLRRAHDSGAVPVMLESKQRFYYELYLGAGNEILRAQAALLQDRLFMLRQRSLARKSRAAASIEEIEQVMERILARDAAGASELWGKHIHQAASAALEVPVG